MSDNNDVWETLGCGMKDVAEDAADTSGFSEHQLLDIMYNACNTTSTGEVSATTIIQYLQNMTAQSPEQERLISLRRLLDPHHQDPVVSRDVFHLTMRTWIAQCNQDSTDADGANLSHPDSSIVPVNELDFLCSQSKAASSESYPCFCDGSDLSGAVAELKQAHRKLSEQNSSLLRTVAQCEDVNLQLTLEIAELRAKLASAQRSAVRARSLTEELEETRQAFKEAQERANRTQGLCTKLGNEVECLKIHTQRLEEKNEKLTFEKMCCEEKLGKIRNVNAGLRSELQETLVVLTLRDKEIQKKDILMNKMKDSHVNNHSIIESLQAELMRLQEHSHQVLLRYNRLCIAPQSVYARDTPNLRSLRSEIQDTQQRHGAPDDISLPSLHAESDDIQSIIHRIKSTEIAHLLHNRYPERDSPPVETQERPFPHSHQQQASIKRQLVNVLQEYELRKCVWEEKGENLEERSRAQKKEPAQSPTGTQTKKVAVVKWWKALSAEGAKARARGAPPIEGLPARTDLQRAERTISDMREQVCRLQASLKSARERSAEEKTHGEVLVLHKETNTDGGEEKPEGEKIGRERRDAAVATDPVRITGGAPQKPEPSEARATADGLLTALRRMEAMVTSALHTAELVRESEHRVSKVWVRMESITQRVEATLGKAADTNAQPLQGDARLQPPAPNPPAEAVAAESDPDALDRRGTERPCCPALPPEVGETPRLSMNASGTELGGSSSDSIDDEVPDGDKQLLRGSLLDHIPKASGDSRAAEEPFIFPRTRSRPPVDPAMPTLPEEEEDSPEELDSSSSSPSTSTPSESRTVAMSAPTIIYPQQAAVVQQDGRPLEQTRPHSPRSRLARTSGGPITTIDSTGNVIDLVKDQLPEMQLTEEDRQKNLELLEQAKKASDRFLMRRGRRSTSSLTDSTADGGSTDTTAVGSQSGGQHLEVPSMREQSDVKTQDQESSRLVVDWKLPEKRKVSSGTLTPRFAVPKENFAPSEPKSPPAGGKIDEGAGQGRIPSQAPATGVAKPVPRPPTQQAPCTAEIKTIGAFPPLMRAVSWDAVGGINSRNGAPGFPPVSEESVADKPRDAVFKSPGQKELPTQPGNVQKLSKLREEHKLIRSQGLIGSKLPDLSETAEQEKGPPAFPKSAGKKEETKAKSDAMPNISDVMLRKLKLHRGLPGCAPPLTEKEVENAFVQLSLAFRNDNYTLETRLKQAERERNLTEEDTEKELEEFKGALKMTAPQWQNLEQRESYQRLIETVAVLHRLATRLSSRAEIVGAVRQEKRMNKATEVMMQYVENLKRTYEKDHAELMEFKKLANQNSNRCYGGSAETGDDGGARPSRSMSLTLGKALPRRRVSVAVVPKFNLLNIPGQTPATNSPGPPAGPNATPAAGAALPAVNETNDAKGNSKSESAQPAAECGKSASEQEAEPAKPQVNMEELRAEIRTEITAKIEEEAYNKGYQEGLKQSKAIQQQKREEGESAAEKPLESKLRDEESGKKINAGRRMDEVLVLLGHFFPKVSWNKRLVCVAVTVFLFVCLVISIFT